LSRRMITFSEADRREVESSPGGKEKSFCGEDQANKRRNVSAPGEEERRGSTRLSRPIRQRGGKGPLTKKRPANVSARLRKGVGAQKKKKSII